MLQTKGATSPLASPAKHRRLTQEVAEGKRSPQSLFAIPESIVRNAKMTFPKEHEGSRYG